MISSSSHCWSHEKIEHILLQQSEEKLLMKTDFLWLHFQGGCQQLSLSALAQMLTLSDRGVNFLLFFMSHLVKAVESNGPHEII